MQQLLSTTINFDLALRVVMILGTMSWLPGISQNSLQFIVLDYGGILLFAISAISKPVREFNNYNLLIILAICILSSLLSNFKAFPIHFIHVISGLLMYYSVVRSTKSISYLTQTLIWICILNLGMAAIQKMGLNPIYSEYLENPSVQNIHFSNPGFMARNYHLAYLLGMVLPIMISNPSYWWLAGVSIIFILSTKSFSLILALGLMGLLFCLREMGLWVTVCLTIIITLILFLNFNSQIRGKLEVRKESYFYAIKESFINPFKGNGIGSFEADIINSKKDLPSSFNQYLRIVYEIGILSSLIIIAGLIAYFSQFQPMHRGYSYSFIMAFTYPMFHEVLRFARLDILLIVLVAMYEINCIKHKEIGKWLKS